MIEKGGPTAHPSRRDRQIATVEGLRWTRRSHSATTPDCPARGQTGQGNICIHSWKDHCYPCRTCGQTFAATRGTPFFRLKTPTDVVTLVLTLLYHGCSLQAIVVAFGLVI
jgi:hypothetical protein